MLKFQKYFILEVYYNPHGTSTAYLSFVRKNGKFPPIAAVVLAHLVGLKQSSRNIFGTRSCDQASLALKLSEKVIGLSPELSKTVWIVPSQRMLLGLACNVEIKTISAESATAKGLSPRMAILDEVRQPRGPNDPFLQLSKRLM